MYGDEPLDWLHSITNVHPEAVNVQLQPDETVNFMADQVHADYYNSTEWPKLVHVYSAIWGRPGANSEFNEMKSFISVSSTLFCFSIVLKRSNSKG